MGFKATVNKNGMVGELYFVIVHANDRKLQGVSDVTLRSFESREVLHEALATENENGISYVTHEEFEIPLDENKNLTTESAYKWIKENHYLDAIDM